MEPVSPKCWYLTTSPHGSTPQKTDFNIFCSSLSVTVCYKGDNSNYSYYEFELEWLSFKFRRCGMNSTENVILLFNL
jgi:hypothetical protein